MPKPTFVVVVGVQTSLAGLYRPPVNRRAALSIPLRPAFATWLAQRLPVEYKLPADVAALATHFDVAGALSRVRERAGGLGLDVIRALRPEANGEHGLSMTDLVLGEWWSQDHG